jgi:hypothetical protein
VASSGGRVELRPASSAPAGDPLAGVFRRFAAWVIDIVAVTVLIFVGVTIVGEVVGPTVRFHPEAAALPDTVAVDTGMVVLNALVATGLSAAYFVLPWAVLGGSPGQLALRMRVRRDTSSEPLTVGRALARWALLFPPFATVSALTAGVPLLGWFVWGGAAAWYLVLLLTTAGSETKQGLHDRLAHSVVCKRRVATG